VLNDVSAGCWHYKDEVKEERFCLITVSSGIGNKVFDKKHEDKIITLSNGLGGEIGHAFMDSNKLNMPCDCGSRGHLGAISSGRGTERFAKMYSKENTERFNGSLMNSLSGGDPEKLNNNILVRSAKEKDPFALEIIKKASMDLAIVIQQMYMAIGVQKFIITGGFALSIGDDYLRILKDNLRSIGFWGLEPERIEALLELSDDDDTVNQRGMGKYVLYKLQGAEKA